MQCKNHNDREGLTVCSVCNEYFCDECIDTETSVCLSCKEKQNLSNDILNDILDNIETPNQEKINFDPTDILTQIENEINVQQEIEKLDFEINNISSNDTDDIVVAETVVSEMSLKINDIEDSIVDTLVSDSVIETSDIEDVISDTLVSDSVIDNNDNEDVIVDTLVSDSVIDNNDNEDVIVDTLVSESDLDNSNLNKIDLSKDSANTEQNSSKTKEWKQKLFGEKSSDCNTIKEKADNIADATKEATSNFADATKEVASNFANATKETAGNIADATKNQAHEIAEDANELKNKTQENFNDLKEKINESQEPPVSEDIEDIIHKIEDTNDGGEYDHLLSRFHSYYGQGSAKSNSSDINDEANLALPVRINSVLYFIASLIPGGAQLYLGLTKRGTTILIIAAVFLFLTKTSSLFLITAILSFADAQKLRNIYYRGGKIEDTNTDIMALIKNGYVVLIIIAAVILRV